MKTDIMKTGGYCGSIPIGKWRIADALKELNDILINNLELATAEEVSVDMCAELAVDIAQGSRLDAETIRDLAAYIYVRATALKEAGLV